MRPLDLDELEERARRVLAPGVFDYIAGGAFDELTLAANVADWAKVRLRPRVLRDVSSVSTATTVLGSPVGTPVLVAPTAFHRMAHPDGEPATAKGVAAAESLFVLSTRSTTPVEEVAAAVGDSTWWYQVYVLQEREFTSRLVRRAVESGAAALVLTVDTPVIGRRLRDIRNRFEFPSNLGTVESLDRPGNLADQDATVVFEDIGWLGDLSGLPVVVKGVLRGDDARRCVEAGAAGVIVSNHGGRQLDGAISSAAALPEVHDAVGPDVEVYVDGGLRRGTDVLKAIALGARAVLLGRPVLWGLAARGADGVADVIRGYTDELALAMSLAGCPRIDDITADLVRT